MPVSTGIDLYLAKSVGELNNKAEIPNKNVAPKVYVKTAEKLIADANRCSSLGDEEKAYVLFMRYFNIITIVKKSQDYKKNKDFYDKLIGKRNLLQAIDKAESLSKSLTNRYELQQAEIVSKKLEALEDEREKINKKNLEAEKLEKEELQKEEKNKEVHEPEPTPGLFHSGTISAGGLYDLLLGSPDDLIIMDTRSSSEFNDSHLRHKSVINVPVEIIRPGTTVPRIETSLPPESKELWSKRANKEYIILLDWNSTIDKVGPGKTLQTLKDALFKFDSQTLLKSSPLILEGGYDDWCMYYPVMMTQPVRDRPIYNKPLSNIPSWDFDYPDLDAAFLTTPTPEVKPSNGLQFGFTLDQSESAPSVVDGGLQKPRPSIPDRAKKPSLTSSSNLNSQNSKQSIERINNDMSVPNQSLYPSMVSSVESNNFSSNKTTTTATDFSNFTSKTSKVPGDQKPKSNIVAEQERELESLRNLQSQKKEELLAFQKEKERMALEHKARLEQLKKRQFEIDTLEKMKSEQTRDVADLMRLKRRLENEMKIERKNEEESNREKAVEEKRRTAELERMKVEEDTRMERLKAVEQSRMERKQKEESDKIRLENQRKEEEGAKLADEEKLRLGTIELERIDKELKQRERREIELKQIDAELERQKKAKEEDEVKRQKEESDKVNKRVETERQEKEAEVKRRQEIILQQEREREEIRKKEEDLKMKVEQQKIAEEKARLEKERLNQEKRDMEKKEKERKDKERAEEARKIAEERLKKISEAEKKPVESPSSMLPVGWERKLDRNTNRYFYLNHNEGTSQWDPPQSTTTASSSPAHSKVYKTKLREETDTPRSGGLMRSHSSPNIAQLVEDEENASKPMFNRGAKPTVKPLTSQTNTNRTVNVKAARMRDLNPVYGTVGGALSGLRNLGNTCYMNSTLQCLNNCIPLVSYFMNDNYVEDINRESKFSYNGEVVDEFAVVVKALWSGQYKSISARDFKSICSRYNSLFANFDQQDSQEFLAFLLDGLHEGLNRIKFRPKLQELDTDNLQDNDAADKSWANHKLHNESIIQELFQGVLKSTVVCLTCHKKSTRFDIFQYLTLPLPSPSSGCSLQDCLRLFLREEKLTGSSKWKCPRCKVDREAVKKLDLWKLPHILIIHLNRFFYEGVWRQKLNTFVDFPTAAMDLDNIVAGPRRGKPYSLYAVSNHYGTMEGGHYTAYGKNPCTNEWHTFDDTEVRKMSRNDVKTSAAYFLFYTCLEQK